MSAPIIVNDVTQLNPIGVWAIAKPISVTEVQEAIRRTSGPVSLGGGHFSMGGQTASPGSLHLDLRKLNQIVAFSPIAKTIRVQAGVRWCDIQRFIDPHGLAVKIMQSYANFTVGGSVSVNVHGRYMGHGPLILSIRSISVVLVNGDLMEVSPTSNAELFYGVVGGYGGLGVIVEVELDLAENTRIERNHLKMATRAYSDYFRRHVRDSSDIVFHNADLYAPHYTAVRSVSWVKTDKLVTVPHRLMARQKSYPLQKYFTWAISETPFGKWRREYIVDPLLYLGRKVVWRNYEAGYDVAELQPPSRKHRTYVLQEYFVPVERFEEFVPRMAEIFQRHHANVLNVSVRHAFRDPGSLLAWATGETFAFVVYYKQRTRTNARERVAVWTRELINAVLSVGGTYYLPYQAHATQDQFLRAYPRAIELFALKRKIDPEFRLRNVLWDKYYAPTLIPPVEVVMTTSEFHSIYSNDVWSDAFYRFLQNIFHLYPEDRFHTLIKEACAVCEDDSSIYRHIQQKLPSIKPFLSELFYALPALSKQKKEMTRQTLQLLGAKRDIDGYVEIGTTGRYISDLRKHLRLRGAVTLVNDLAPTNSPVDIVERGQLNKLGNFVPINRYMPIAEKDIASLSADLVTCYIGLHHIEPSGLMPFVLSIHRILRPGGTFILRDHDVTTPEMDKFVALAHTVFNAGLGAPWETNQQELRYFVSADEWVRRLGEAGFRDQGEQLAQANDPTDNLLMAFVKA